MMKGQKGITLVALIITIIVMLILVGVSISVALNGGLFDNARDAARKTQQAQVSEAAALAKAEVLSAYYNTPAAETYTWPTGPEFADMVEEYLDGVTMEAEMVDGEYTLSTDDVEYLTGESAPVVDLKTEYAASNS
ncbi:MAG: type II secretion system protein [Clostridia bacterium]|nr:type II secretion system protein [Clostridia bacterium]